MHLFMSPTPQARSVPRPVHNNGDLVSTVTRFSDRNAFKIAVGDEYRIRGFSTPLLIIHKSYSFPEPVLNPTQEVLIMWLPGNATPTQQNPGPSVLTINYYYLNASTQNSFEQMVDSMCGPGSGRTKMEDSYQSPRGRQDGNNTYRAVVKVDNGLAFSYEGWMTNPPYPAKKRAEQPSKSKWLLPAVLGLAAGLAAIPLIRARRVRPKD